MSCHGYCGILSHSQITSSSEQGEKREEEGGKKPYGDLELLTAFIGFQTFLW